MPLKNGKGKATINSNISEFHTGKTYAHTAAKYGKKRANAQAVAVALSQARKSRARGGYTGPDGDEMLTEDSITSQLARNAAADRLRRQVIKRADGGEVREMVPPPENPAAAPKWLQEGAVDVAKGAIQPIMSAGDVLGDAMRTRQMPAASDVIQAGTELGTSLIGPSKSIFLGPIGMKSLRGKLDMHPAVRETATKGFPGVNEYLKDPVVSRALQASRERRAEGILAERASAGDAGDEGMFKLAGMHRGEEGIVRREVPDLGATLIPAHEKGQYWLIHPEIDLHKEYGIPAIKIKPGVAGEGGWNRKTGEITLHGDPSYPSQMKKMISAALHEAQHAVQRKEGMGAGSAPGIETLHPQMYEHGYGIDKNESLGEQARMLMALGINDPKAFDAYRRSSGEVEARNVQTRRGKGFNYLKHPRETEDVPQGLQIVRSYDEMERPVAEYEKKARKYGGRADGGGVAPWYTRQQARGMGSGLGKSGLLGGVTPGRTDTLPIKVGNGGYVIPADIVSALGQGNTQAGGSILGKMFSGGSRMASRIKAGRSPKGGKASVFADGGAPEGEGEVPIIAASGEYVLDPEQVASAGNGDVDRGHKVLDAFVRHVRKEHIKTLKKLPGPVKK